MHRRTSTLLLVAGAIGVTTAATLVVASTLAAQGERAAELHTLEGVAHSLSLVERGQRDKLAAALDAILADDGLRVAFQRRDRAALLREAKPLFDQLRQREDV